MPEKIFQKNSFRWTALCLLFPLSSFAVIGGVKLRLDDRLYQSTVGILIQMNGSSAFCSGVLIAPRVVLTAVHCILENEEGTQNYRVSSSMKVGFGAAAMKLNDPSLVRNVLKAEFHPKNLEHLLDKTPGGWRHDLALLLLDADAPKGFVPAKLSSRITDMQPGEEMTLAGFGCVLDEGTDHQPIGIKAADGLHAVKSKIASWTPLVVTAEKGRGGSFGDSGMPAYFFDGSGEPVVGAIASVTTQVHFQVGKHSGDDTTFLSVPAGPENMSWLTKVLTSWSILPLPITKEGRGPCPALTRPRSS